MADLDEVRKKYQPLISLLKRYDKALIIVQGEAARVQKAAAKAGEIKAEIDGEIARLVEWDLGHPHE